MSYRDIIVSRVKIDAVILMEEFERLGFKFEEETATEYIDIFGEEDLNEMCQWIENMEDFLEDNEGEE